MSRRLKPEECVLMVVDVQERLLPQIHEHDHVNAQCAKLARGASVLGVPIIWTEQYKKGLGETTPEIRAAIGDGAQSFEKMSFGCLADPKIHDEVKRIGRRKIILCGIEAHICVAQTALQAMDEGYDVALAEDAVSSRRPSDCETGIARMRQAGVIPATVEMLLMEWLGEAGTPQFKQILPLIK